jgi:hypothetical protein
MAKNIENIKRAKNMIIHYIDLGETDNIELFKKLKKARLGLMPKELEGLVNKYTDEYLINQGWLK